VRVQLSAEQVGLAINAGLRRQLREYARRGAGAKPRARLPGRDDTVCCLGEVAVAEVFGLPWDGFLFDDDSVEVWTKRAGMGLLQVRTVGSRRDDFIIGKDDPDDVPYVFVLAAPDWKGGVACDLVGWRMGMDCHSLAYDESNAVIGRKPNRDALSPVPDLLRVLRDRGAIPSGD
jgi:hypothetical protein